ncbi:MAG TPA: hypothetical protein VFS48_07025 [Solirubrobacterales bacterium]|nr:hypothetical protein [Solirubrobacterales bacterium]
MGFVFLRFLDNLMEWAATGRFPREELRIRWWIAVPGIAVLTTLVVALIIASV